MASYMLLSHHKLGLIAEGLTLMRWLSQQRNDRGGFRGTQVRRHHAGRRRIHAEQKRISVSRGRGRVKQ